MERSSRFALWLARWQANAKKPGVRGTPTLFLCCPTNRAYLLRSLANVDDLMKPLESLTATALPLREAHGEKPVNI